MVLDETITKQEYREAMDNFPSIIRELNNRSFYHFIEYFWNEISNDEFKTNWHIPYLANELQKLAERAARKLPKKHDLIINIPPGTTKTITCSIMFPAWIWTRWYWMRVITASYSGTLSLESAEYSRDLIKSAKFKEIYPELEIKQDKDTKTNYKIMRKVHVTPGFRPQLRYGGNRFSTSVGGTLTGFHGHILIVDDPIDPRQAFSEKELETVNHWMEQTLPTRKTDKAVTPTLLIMQRLHQDDPSGRLLSKKKANVKHICLPGELKNYGHTLFPTELKKYYTDGLLDPVRMPWGVLKDLEADLGQYGFAGQIGQDPSPPGGGMFKVKRFNIAMQAYQKHEIIKTVRYWDKAGTDDAGAYTVGVKISQLKIGKWIIEDVVRGQWSAEKREKIIRKTAEVDGPNVGVYIEQEPGSGGLESAQGTIRNLAGYSVYADRPTGNKIFRADPYSVQVNEGNFIILHGEWNHSFLEEHRYFPLGTYKDQVDAAAGAFNKLVRKRIARRVT